MALKLSARFRKNYGDCHDSRLTLAASYHTQHNLLATLSKWYGGRPRDDRR